MPNFQDPLEREMIAHARAEEIHQNSGATGFTLLKFRKTPVDQLASDGAISLIELEAAREYSGVFDDLAADLRFASPQHVFIDRQSKANNDRPPTEREQEVWKRYKDFTNHWSLRRKLHKDRTLAIFVQAVIDQRPWEHIAEDNAVSPMWAKGIVVNALRDYAKRAGWVDAETLKRWGNV